MYREAEGLKVTQSVTNQAGTPHQIWLQSLSSFPMSSDLNTYLSIKPSPQAWDQSSSWWWVSWGLGPIPTPGTRCPAWVGKEGSLPPGACRKPGPAGAGRKGQTGQDSGPSRVSPWCLEWVT